VAFPLLCVAVAALELQCGRMLPGPQCVAGVPPHGCVHGMWEGMDDVPAPSVNSHRRRRSSEDEVARGWDVWEPNKILQRITTMAASPHRQGPYHNPPVAISCAWRVTYGSIDWLPYILITPQLGCICSEFALQRRVQLYITQLTSIHDH
jgi:hypothetical protein